MIAGRPIIVSARRVVGTIFVALICIVRVRVGAGVGGVVVVPGTGTGTRTGGAAAHLGVLHGDFWL